MTAAPKAKPRQMLAIFNKDDGELYSANLHSYLFYEERMALVFIGSNKDKYFTNAVLVTPIEEDA